MSAGQTRDREVEPEEVLAPSSVVVPTGDELARLAADGGTGATAGAAQISSAALSQARADEAAEWDAVVLSSFGGPEGQDDVIPFLRNVTRGRGIPDERLEEVATHYRANGGVSPINAQNRALLAALEAEMRDRGVETPILWANRNWEPYVGDVVRQLHDEGKDRVLVLATSAFSGYSSCRQYREDYGVAVREAGLQDRMTIGKIRQYYDSEGFLLPFVEGLETALTEITAQDSYGEGPTRILFAAHSVPDVDAVASGPEQMRDRFVGGSAYVHQLLSASREIMARLADRAGHGSVDQLPDWELVFQSRSGSPKVPWLEPDVNDAIEKAAGDGVGGVIVVPIGFVSDHMEVIWDLDTEARETAAEQGLAFIRTATPGTHPAFVAALVDLIEQRMVGRSAPERVSACAEGTWFDTCAAECCTKVLRGATEPRPTVAQREPGAPLPVGTDDDGAVVYA
ncbi:ferrochelatase [Kocuria sp. JC486]|uniref:Coproporphyrin III ferrochelatase n=1 Tax=Kocuria soli TaxID=2485125 RepID=A0A3N3ZNY8_9MICC|nr:MULTISPECIES: ferrochelatase [Kocuria]NHU84443.1 ferrochelatase [Kocuria sp. JC486]ROZ62645.1 ferrochelatase [Kocuria soli]